MLKSARVPILGLAAFSNVGKTTLLAKLLPLLKGQGLRVGAVKHAPHGFDIDRPGKDSYELREAGAAQILIGSQQRWALMTETDGQEVLRLDELLRHLDQDSLDCVLVEGFKHESFPKIEVHRPSLGHPLLCVEDRSIIAVASDGPLSKETHLPLLDLNNPSEIVEFICERLFGAKRKSASKPK
ncbi:MAG: molybdopterin-guanine dinucleotide biosynthesis protein B [Acidiferrobacterales bacterium]